MICFAIAMRTHRHLRVGTAVLAGVIVATWLTGCSPEPKFYPVRGKIIVFGVGPLTEGEIRFRPVSRPDLVATGKIQPDGTFSASTPGHEGALEGDCQVAIVVEPKGGKRAIAERYGDYATSDLNYTIAARDENYFMFDVKKPGQ